MSFAQDMKKHQTQIPHHLRDKEWITFEVCLNGWEGATDANDHLVKWIKCPDMGGPVRLLRDLDLKLAEGSYVEPILGASWYGLEDGVDCYVDTWGKILVGELGRTTRMHRRKVAH